MRSVPVKSNPRRILLADDDPKVCSALRLILEEEPDLRVVCEVNDERGLFAYLQAMNGATSSADLPELLLIDWELPGLNPAEQLPALRAACPDLKLIALSVRMEVQQAAMLAGVDAYISKSDPPDRVMAALRSLLV